MSVSFPLHAAFFRFAGTIRRIQMRVTFTFADPYDLWNFNIGAWTALRAVFMLSQTSVVDRHENILRLTYPKATSYAGGKNDGTVFDGTVKFYSRDENGTEYPLELTKPFGLKLSYVIPKEWNSERAFMWLYTEVAKLAYAMTEGRVFPAYGIAEDTWDEETKSHILEFMYAGDVDEY